MGEKRKPDLFERSANCIRNASAGFMLTFILIFAVPIIIDLLVAPYVTEKAGSASLGFLTPDMVAGIVLLAVMLVFTLCLGGSAIMARYGLFGILGLILAYAVIGRLYDSAIPVLIAVIVWLYASVRSRKRGGSKRRGDR